MFDGDAFGQQMVEIVRGYVAAEIEPLRAENKALAEANAALSARLDELETRELVLPEIPQIDMGAITTEIDGKVAAAVAALPVPQDGKDADMDAVKEYVLDVAASLPKPKDGADCDMEAVKRLIAEEVVTAVSTLPPAEKGEPGSPGRDVDMGEVAARIETAVKSAVEALPAPGDGEPGKDGLGLANALIDRDGGLVITMSDGTTKSLGSVVGRDGEPGKDGETLTLDDFDIIPLDERSIKLCFTRGDTMHSFELEFPVPIYRGVFKEGDSYSRGDMVTWGGSCWAATKEATGKPGDPDAGWMLAVKAGRPGKDAK